MSVSGEDSWIELEEDRELAAVFLGHRKVLGQLES